MPFTIVFKRMLSVLADKSLIPGIFNSSENTPRINLGTLTAFPKCRQKRNPANILQMKMFHSHISQSTFRHYHLLFSVDTIKISGLQDQNHRYIDAVSKYCDVASH